MAFQIFLPILLIAAPFGNAQDEPLPGGSICLLSSQDTDTRRAARKTRMIGGRAAQDNEFPWQVSIRVFGRHICGGSLIHEEWVLTAAHCLRNRNPKFYLAEVGFVFDEDSHKQISEVEQLIPHALFGSQGHKHDIGLIKIRNAFQLSSAVASICLPDPSYRLMGGGVVVSGWGVVMEGSTKASSILRVVAVPFVSKRECARTYSNFWSYLLGSSVDSKSMFCAGFPNGGKDACQGDSGGPAIQFIDEIPTQVGIVSWGKGCARAGKPGVYTEIAFFVPWVLETIRNFYQSQIQLGENV